MKKTLLVLVIGLTTFSFSYASGTSENYTIDDQKVEQLFNNSFDVSLSAVNQQLFAQQGLNSGMQAGKYFADGGKNFVTALLLNFFLGGLGIHRLYLGTKTMTWVGYILTCGGIFGIVPLVDFIVLIVHNDDISPYVDNPRFFMWSGQ